MSRRRRGSVALALLVASPLLLSGVVAQEHVAGTLLAVRQRDQVGHDAARLVGQRLVETLDGAGAARAEALAQVARQVGLTGLAAAASAGLSPGEAARWTAAAARHLPDVGASVRVQAQLLAGVPTQLTRDLREQGLGGVVVEPAGLELPRWPGVDACRGMWEADPATGLVPLAEVARTAGPIASGYLPGGGAAFAATVAGGVSACSGLLGATLAQPPEVVDRTVSVGGPAGTVVVRIRVEAAPPGGVHHRLRLVSGDPARDEDSRLALVP